MTDSRDQLIAAIRNRALREGAGHWITSAELDELTRPSALTAESTAALGAIDRLEQLGRAGLVISICYGPTPKGLGYSVDCLHDASKGTFSRAFAARSFEHCLEIVAIEAKARGWLADAGTSQ